jgi:tRNA(Ile)-lysidine synthase
VSAADDAAPVSAAEAKTLFDPLASATALVLAVSGGPDSTALLLMAAHWRRARKTGPRLLAVTIDHGLRRESAGEARAVARLARALGVPHRILRWTGKKPATGLQQNARDARYRLLAKAAARAKAGAIVTAHTLDDQAETVLIRMSRGSGLGGLGAMTREAPLPVGGEAVLVRPLLEIPKARLIATLRRARIAFADDPSNRDPRFTRARLREVMCALAGEGLDARRLSLLARRLRRAEAAIEAAVDGAMAALSPAPWSERGPIVFDAGHFNRLPAEVALRLLGRAIARTGDEGSLQLGKLEILYEALQSANADDASHWRRTLAGALVTLGGTKLAIERAPARRAGAARAVWKLKKLAKSATQGRQDGKRN